MSSESASISQVSPFGNKNVPECTTPIEVKVQGQIPSWVNGVLYRVGHGIFSIPRDDGTVFHMNHPFDGLAMLHRFEIHGGENPRILYNSRHTANGVKSRILRNDDTLVFFGPDPCKTLFGRIKSVYHHLMDFKLGELERRIENDNQSENINVAIGPNFPLGEDLEKEWGVNAGMALVVKTDANILQLIDNETLEPKKLFTYGKIDQEYNDRFSASHHQTDDETGEWFNFILEIFPKPTWRVFSYSTPIIPGPTKVKKFQPITENLSKPTNLIFPKTVLKASYTHSFSLTKNYVIIPNWSYYFSYNSLSILWYGNAYESLYFDPNLPTLFHVLNRQTGLHVATYESDPAFSFHTINAWDEDGTVWMDIATYKSSKILDSTFEFARMYHEEYVKPASCKSSTENNDEDSAIAQVRRYKLSDIPDLPSNTPRRAEYEILGLDLDLPRFDPRRKNKPYRYVYGTCENKHSPIYKGISNVHFTSVQKMDLGPPPSSKSTHSEQIISNVPNNKIDGSGPNTCRFDPISASCSEPIFLPNPSGKDEDDGVVLTMINEIKDDVKEICALVVLNAKDMTEMARAEVGFWHAKTVHGSFVDQFGHAITIS